MEKSIFILDALCMYALVFQRNKTLPGSRWNTCNTSMQIILIKRKKKRNKRKKISSLQLFGTRATWRNILKISGCVLTIYLQKLNEVKTRLTLTNFRNYLTKRIILFLSLKKLHVLSYVRHLLKKWKSSSPQQTVVLKLIHYCCKPLEGLMYVACGLERHWLIEI